MGASRWPCVSKVSIVLVARANRCAICIFQMSIFLSFFDSLFISFHFTIFVLIGVLFWCAVCSLHSIVVIKHFGASKKMTILLFVLNQNTNVDWSHPMSAEGTVIHSNRRILVLSTHTHTHTQSIYSVNSCKRMNFIFFFILVFIYRHCLFNLHIQCVYGIYTSNNENEWFGV